MPQAQAARETLEQAQQLLEKYPEQTAKLSTAAKAKGSMTAAIPPIAGWRVAIIVAGIARRGVWHYGPDPWRECGRVLRPCSAWRPSSSFRRPCAAYRQEQQESHRPGVGALHLRRGCPAAGGLPGAGPVRPPCGAAADDPVLREGPCPERGEALNVR